MNAAERDEFYIGMSLKEAVRGLGWTPPNPLVGCIIVKNSKVVSRGAHLKDGTAHAEQAAIAACPPDALEGATLYVNLEPCTHTGRTPPCTSIIIEARIARVVWGDNDSDRRTAGKAESVLEAAGIETKSGVLRSVCRNLNRVFHHWQRFKAPYVAAKMAVSGDGKIAAKTGEGGYITSEASRGLVHIIRQHFDAVLIGAGTLVADNPKLTVRKREVAAFRSSNPDMRSTFAGLISAGEFEKPRHPVAIVLDGSGRAMPGMRVFDARRRGRLKKSAILAVPRDKFDRRRKAFERLDHVEVLPALYENGKLIWCDLFARLPDYGVHSVLVEGGSKVFSDMLMANQKAKGAILNGVFMFKTQAVLGESGVPLIHEDYKDLRWPPEFTKKTNRARILSDEYTEYHQPLSR